MIRRPPRSTLDRSSAASDVYKRQLADLKKREEEAERERARIQKEREEAERKEETEKKLSLIHISEPTRPY